MLRELGFEKIALKPYSIQEVLKRLDQIKLEGGRLLSKGINVSSKMGFSLSEKKLIRKSNILNAITKNLNQYTKRIGNMNDIVERDFEVAKLMKGIK